MGDQSINSSGSQGGMFKKVAELQAKNGEMMMQVREQATLANIREDIQKLLTGKDGKPIKPENLTAEQFIQYEIMLDECKKLEVKMELQKQQNEAKAESQRELKMNREPSDYEIKKMMAGEKNKEKPVGMATTLARMQKLSEQKAEVQDLIKQATSEEEKIRLETLYGILETELNEAKKALADDIKYSKPKFDK